jgi:hypothetical protein
MPFLNRFERRINWDYRDYCDYRTRQKRRLRLRLSIGLTLMLCLALAAGLGAMMAGVWAQPLQQTGDLPGLKPPIHLQAPDRPSMDLEIQQFKS